MKKMQEQNDWRGSQQRQRAASQFAEDILEVIGCTKAPIDPLAIARRQRSSLRFAGENFGDRFDGQLEYHPRKKRFLLFYNNKYNAGYVAGEHHPRTRFSIAHELAHYFLDHHRRLLLVGRKPHKSTSEFRSDVELEREADAFAAALLMPSCLLKPAINRAPLSLARLQEVAAQFETSLLSSAIRSVQFSDFPCGLIGIRDGAVAWMLVSPPLIKAGIYPRGRGTALSSPALEAWARFQQRIYESTSREVRANHWFKFFKNQSESVWATEECLPVPVLKTLLVLVSLDEDDLMDNEYEPSDEDDE